MNAEMTNAPRSSLSAKQALLGALSAFIPANEQEMRDRDEIARWIKTEDKAALRDCLAAHLTASAWVVSPDRKQVLMAYHNIYNSWAWLGGHADGEFDLCAVARREVMEESGLTELRLLTSGIFSIEILTVYGHEKRGQYVPSHLHLNVTYLFEGDPDAPVFVCPDENSAVRWLRADALSDSVSEAWMQARIYTKLMQKVEKL